MKIVVSAQGENLDAPASPVFGRCPTYVFVDTETLEFEAIPNENDPPSAEDAGNADSVEGVFVVEGGIARFRPVKVGVAGDRYFEVLSGLEEGVTIVSGTFQAIRELSDGDAVRVDEDEDSGGDDRSAQENQD